MASSLTEQEQRIVNDLTALLSSGRVTQVNIGYHGNTTIYIFTRTSRPFMVHMTQRVYDNMLMSIGKFMEDAITDGRIIPDAGLDAVVSEIQEAS